MKKFFRVCRAREEVVRCNVEIHRLFTPIHNEAHRYSNILEALAGQGSPIFGAVSEYSTCRGRVNTLLLAQIQQVFSLDGFTGATTLGHRKGSQCSQEAKELGGGNYTDDHDAESKDADDMESN